MSLSKTLAVVAILAYAEARFGQEQIPVAAVQALGDAGFGDPGVAATIAGSIPSSLLAAASPCDKLTIADQIIDELGTDQQVVDAAIGLVAAETNFNPFAVNVPFVCADATLPVNEQLRGIVPLVDPAVGGSDLENANSETSIGTPFDAQGLSQAEVMIAQGFGNFTAVDGNGDNIELAGQDGAADGGAADDTAGNDGTADSTTDASPAATATTTPVSNSPCGGGNNAAIGNGTADAAPETGNTGNATLPAATPSSTAQPDDATDDGADDGQATGGDLDFGQCQPTMARVGGLNGRPADEFTFIPQDPLVAEGQQEALNPNIITNRICDQLINVCEASDAAHTACLDAKAEIEALGTRDQSTADTWNALLGFAGVDSTQATL